jgi:hypothetical protein
MMTHSWALKRYSLKEYSLFRFKEMLIDFVMQGIIGKGKSMHELDRQALTRMKQKSPL